MRIENKTRRVRASNARNHARTISNGGCSPLHVHLIRIKLHRREFDDAVNACISPASGPRQQCVLAYAISVSYRRMHAIEEGLFLCRPPFLLHPPSLSRQMNVVGSISSHCRFALRETDAPREGGSLL